jgi:pyruvate formate lyase activating enzyme
MNIRGIYKTSLIDFPGKISSVIFCGGCNLRCGYCHNPELACDWKRLALLNNEEVLDFLRKRKNVLEGVTISGGEPTLSPRIDSFLGQIKELPLAVKLDSNGLHPEVIARLAGKKLIDYVAIDLKTSPGKYRDLTNADIDFSRIAESVEVLRRSGIEYEVRTTCVPGYVTLGDLADIAKAIGHVAKYCLQQFVPTVRLIDSSCEAIEPYPAKTLFQFRDFVLSFADACEVRGV